MKLSQDVQISLTVAVSEAGRLGHEYAGMEHLLHALTLDDETARVLRHAGGDPERLRRRLEEYLTEALEREDGDGRVLEPRLSLALQRTLARAAAAVEGAGRGSVEGPDLLVALFAEGESFAVALLEQQGVTRLDVVSYLAHGESKLPVGGRGGMVRRRGALGPGEAAGTRPRPLAPGSPADDEDAASEPATADEALAAYAQDLTELARQGAIDPLVGRRREIDRTLHVLQRRRKNNPLFVGDPGVGKTALVEGLALRVAEGAVPEPFRGARIFRLDLGALVAGTRYRGDFENRVKAVLAALDEVDRPILFVDEIHTLIGAGAAGRGTMDASNLLKPALAAGALRVIGATTWEEFRQTFQRDQALARRFQKIEVDEPSVAETVAIFAGLEGRYAEHHGVDYTRAAVESAAELAARHLADRRLPDKAIDLLDEAGAAVALAGRRRVGVADVERVLATMAQVPEIRVRGNDRERLARLEADLKAAVFGQDEPIERLVAAIKVARAGLRERDKPVGSFLLTGPTGVGKTEVARRLAEVLGVAFLRFDMSEYMERHTVSRLVGAPPGYVGYDRGGLLTEAVAKTPHAVLLLDEIEKAHPDVFNLLLQVMDHGTLTDTNGKRTDFRHVTLLMTSNVGARELAAGAPGFAEGGAAG
ncbi:MAG TPA: AAA family ATPase, partial [Thermoanaerobaculia bacterium]|nr:AAA family ATPase [Thermoanaerobaculia bacterium]